MIEAPQRVFITLVEENARTASWHFAFVFHRTPHPPLGTEVPHFDYRLDLWGTDPIFTWHAIPKTLEPSEVRWTTELLNNNNTHGEQVSLLSAVDLERRVWDCFEFYPDCEVVPGRPDYKNCLDFVLDLYSALGNISANTASHQQSDTIPCGIISPRDAERVVRYLESIRDEVRRATDENIRRIVSERREALKNIAVAANATRSKLCRSGGRRSRTLFS